MASVSGRVDGTSSTRATRRRTQGCTGDTPSATTSSTGATFPMPSTPTLKSPASQAQPWSRTTGLLRCTTGRRSAIWSPSQATRCCSTGRRLRARRSYPLRPWTGRLCRTRCSTPASGRRTASTTPSPLGPSPRARTGRGLRPTSCSARRTWRHGSTCILSPRTTGSRWWGTTGPVPTSGRSATNTCSCSSATRAAASTCLATTTRSATSWSSRPTASSTSDRPPRQGSTLPPRRPTARVGSS